MAYTPVYLILVEQFMTDMAEARLQQIDDMIDALRADDPRVRRYAAHWLGEAAAEPAIPYLINVYLNDQDDRVREASAYALGQFRAIDKALQAGKEDKVVKLLTKVETQGKYGHPARRGRVYRWIVAMLLTLGVLIAAYYFLPDGMFAGSIPVAAPTVDYARRAALAAEMRPTFNQVRDNISTLQTIFTTVLGGGALDCIAYFNDGMTPYTLNPVDALSFPDLAQVAQIMNDGIALQAEARAQIDAICAGGTAFSAGEAGAIYNTIRPSVQNIPLAEVALTAAENQEPLPGAPITAQNVTSGDATIAPPEPTTSEATIAAPTEPAAEPTTAPTTAATDTPAQPTEVPTQTPRPTTEIIVADPMSHLSALYGIVDDMTSDRGPGGLLVQYWTDAQRAGQTFGCTDVTSAASIPENYVLPEADAAASQTLTDAVMFINQGLESLRIGWSVFTAACTANTLTSVATTQLANALEVQESFQVALSLLDQMRSGA